MSNFLTCGSQVVFCDLPIRFDTYRGCSHKCSYCFVKRNYDISKIKPNNNAPRTLNDFINGKRDNVTKWCDFRIPLHWGGVSDPFQPVEKKFGISKECLKIFAKTKYPFAVSTKGILAASDEYLNLISECNCVIQVSMCCSLYDKLEPGAPKFEQRLEMLKEFVKVSKRVIVRCQPYFPEAREELLKNISLFKKIGVYGVILESIKFQTLGRHSGKIETSHKNELVHDGADLVFSKNLLQKDFSEIKKCCHDNGLVFLCGENRLRFMSDQKCCCGVEGMPGFEHLSTFNSNHIFAGERVIPTAAMMKEGTALVFRCLHQDTSLGNAVQKRSFFKQMLLELQNYKHKIQKGE